MSRRAPWKTGSAPPPRRPVIWPSPGQWLRQAVILILISGVWSVLFFTFLRWTQTQQTAVLAAPLPSPTVAPIQPSPTFTLTPTETGTAVTLSTPSAKPSATPSIPPPTDTPLPSPTVTPTSTHSHDTAAISFQNDVLPIFERRCIKCHGGIVDGEERVEEGLKLLTHEDVMKGSYNGPVIEPGDVENSYLIEQIIKGEMPKKEPRLLPGEIRTISAWVEAGAPNN